MAIYVRTEMATFCLFEFFILYITFAPEIERIGFGDFIYPHQVRLLLTTNRLPVFLGPEKRDKE